MKSIVITILMLFRLQFKAQFSNLLVLVGPKFNFNFGNGQHRFSGGLEASAWTFSNSAPHLALILGLNLKEIDVVYTAKYKLVQF